MLNPSAFQSDEGAEEWEGLLDLRLSFSLPAPFSPGCSRRRVILAVVLASRWGLKHDEVGLNQIAHPRGWGSSFCQANVSSLSRLDSRFRGNERS